LAKRHQVLHRLLAKIVINAEDLTFLEIRADLVIQRLSGGEIATDWLFDDDAAVFCDQLLFFEFVRNLAKQARRDGEIECPDSI